MFLLNMLTWWYSAGFVIRCKNLGRRLSRTADVFSIPNLLRTLFSPFKQIDAGATGKGFSFVFQAFLSRLISRFIGLFIRTFLIVAGLVTLIAQSLLSLLLICLHLAIPLLPIAAIALAINGWLPPEIDLVIV